MPERHIQQDGERRPVCCRIDPGTSASPVVAASLRLAHPCRMHHFEGFQRAPPARLQLCERCQTEILDLRYCTPPMWVSCGDSPLPAVRDGCHLLGAGNKNNRAQGIWKRRMQHWWTLQLSHMHCLWCPQFGRAPLCAGECNVGDRVMARAQRMEDVPSDQGVDGLVGRTWRCLQVLG